MKTWNEALAAEDLWIASLFFFPVHPPSTPQVLILHSKGVKWFEVSNAHQQGESTDCCNSIQRCVIVNLFSVLSSLLISDGKMDPEVYKNDMIEYGTFF